MISRRQLHARGITDSWIRARIAAHQWQRIYSGVFASFTGELPQESRMWAALLRCGPGAVLAGETVLELGGMTLRRSRPRRGRIQIAIDQSRKTRVPAGVEIWRVSRLARMVHPALTPPRLRFEPALLLASARQPQGIDAIGLVADACQQRLTTPDRLARTLRSLPQLRGRQNLLRIVDDVSTGSHSHLEVGYLRKVERPHGLPSGSRQRLSRMGRRSVYRDVEYVGFALVVELDGRLGHEDLEGRWADLKRDFGAAICGTTTVRLGYGNVFGDPCRAASGVGRLLRYAGWRGMLRRCGPDCTLDRGLGNS